MSIRLLAAGALPRIAGFLIKKIETTQIGAGDRGQWIAMSDVRYSIFFIL